jgi:hypothetical protein
VICGICEILCFLCHLKSMNLEINILAGLNQI